MLLRLTLRRTLTRPSTRERRDARCIASADRCSWTDSQLREWLLEKGVVSPSSTREQLLVLAKQKASAASTAIYGHPTDQAASSISSAAYGAASSVSSGYNAFSSQAAYAADRASKKLDDAKDYIFSTWDDNQLRTWLEEHDVISTPAPTGRAALLNNVRVAYSKLTHPIYEAWSTSTIHEWLVEHGIVHPEPTARDKLVELMKNNYYDAKETAYTKWSESDMRDWLISEGIM